MTHGAAYCPRLRKPVDEQDVLVPSGVARELVLEAENLPHPQAGHAGFQCLVDIEGAKMAIGARIEGGRFVVCDKTTVRPRRIPRLVRAIRTLPHSIFSALPCSKASSAFQLVQF